MRDRALNRLAEAIRGSGHRIVREEVRETQRGVVLTASPLRVELTNARLVLEHEDLILSQEVRRYEYDFGLDVGDTLVLLPVSGEEWVVTNVISQRDNIATPPPPGIPVFVFNETPAGAVNGANADFTLAQAAAANSTQVTLNGLVLGWDEYSVTGSALTFTVPPRTGSKLLATYITA